MGTSLQASLVGLELRMQASSLMRSILEMKPASFPLHVGMESRNGI